MSPCFVSRQSNFGTVQRATKMAHSSCPNIRISSSGFMAADRRCDWPPPTPLESRLPAYPAEAGQDARCPEEAGARGDIPVEESVEWIGRASSLHPHAAVKAFSSWLSLICRRQGLGHEGSLISAMNVAEINRFWQAAMRRPARGTLRNERRGFRM